MTNTMTGADGTSTAYASIAVGEIVAAARDLTKAGRWHRAADLLDVTSANDPAGRALLALAAAEVAVERDRLTGTNTAGERLRAAGELCANADLDDGSRWDLAFLRLGYDYFGQLFRGESFAPGPVGKDPDLLAGIRQRAWDVRGRAPDERRGGWAEMYLGLIADNLFAERTEAPGHYEAALRAGEAVGDDHLCEEALRHLGDHDHDRGDERLARRRWERATDLAARGGLVQGTLAQQMLLAVLARDAGDEAGATALAREIARWAGALGGVRLEAQATAFLAGVDPTAPPEHD